MNIQQAFNTAAANYDKLRRSLIPCFDDFYGTAVEVISTCQRLQDAGGDRTIPLKALDLGAGTGLYAGMVQAAFPNVEFTLVDLAEEMLAQVKARFRNIDKSSIILLGDYTETDLGDAYDIVISGLSIHHLSDSDKRSLYQRIYNVLSRGGMFINADQVLGKTSNIDKLYRQTWLNAVSVAVSDEELKAAKKRMECDRLAKLNDQLNWLESVGFQDVDCWYKSYSFAVFGGHKPVDEESGDACYLM